MKTKSLAIFLSAFIISVIFSSCKKKDDGTLTFDYRIISSKSYYNNQLDYQMTFEYSGNKISKLTSSEYSNGISSGNEVYSFTYPSATTIHATTTSTQGTQTTTSNIDITLANNKVAESIMTSGSEKSKTTFSYNSDGTVNKISSYNYTTTWVLSSERTFTFSSGKLMQISDIEYFGTTSYERKYVYSYTGDEVKDEIQSNKQTGGTWVESYKKSYTYTSGKISKITEYYKSGTAWTLSYSQDFTYDSNGNLIKESSGTDRTEYTYEKGSGNFLQLSDAFGENDYFYPTPHKKSLKLKSALNIIQINP